MCKRRPDIRVGKWSRPWEVNRNRMETRSSGREDMNISSRGCFLLSSHTVDSASSKAFLFVLKYSLSIQNIEGSPTSSVCPCDFFRFMQDYVRPLSK